MKINTQSIALSGMQAAQQRLRSSAHNVANVLTEDFHPERTVQQARTEGGVSVSVERSATPQSVDLAQEIVNQQLASHQFKAAVRVLETDLGLLGDLLDRTS